MKKSNLRPLIMGFLFVLLLVISQSCTQNPVDIIYLGDTENPYVVEQIKLIDDSIFCYVSHNGRSELRLPYKDAYQVGDTVHHYGQKALTQVLPYFIENKYDTIRVENTICIDSIRQRKGVLLTYDEKTGTLNADFNMQMIFGNR